MPPDIDKVKELHPGMILKREISKKGLKNKDILLTTPEMNL